MTVSPCAVVTVQFNQSVYSVSEEDGQVMLVILVQGQSDIPLELQLQTIGQSATCKCCVTG